jgi:hypothetical protein
VILCLLLAWLVDPTCPELEGEVGSVGLLHLVPSQERAQCVFRLTGQIQAGLPSFQVWLHIIQAKYCVETTTSVV